MKEISKSTIKPLIDIIGGQGKIEEIKKAFGFDIIPILTNLQDYENNLNVLTDSPPSKVTEAPEKIIATWIKSKLVHLKESDIQGLIENHLKNLRLLSKVSLSVDALLEIFAIFT